MLRVLRQFFSIQASEYSDDEILHICGILFVNAHEVPVTATPCQAIFRSASLIEHSCVNNASKHFDMNCNIQVSLGKNNIKYLKKFWPTFFVDHSVLLE